MGKGTNNELANAMIAAYDKEKYDKNIKNILANKIILAWILKYTTDEFRDYAIPVIVDCIENPEVDSVLLHPGRSSQLERGNLSDFDNSGEQSNPAGQSSTAGKMINGSKAHGRITSEKITGMPNEDIIQNEGEIRYDIRFSVYRPSEESGNAKAKREMVKLIINVEAQKDFYPGYNIITRALFYCARLLSAQLGTEFTASRYDDIKKVYSIWLCMDTNEASANTITSYEIHPRSLYGEPKQTFNCDLLRAVMVCVGKKKTRCYNNKGNSGAQLLDLLNVILDDGIPPSEKLGILESDFSIEVTDKMREEMNIMCNLSDLVEERGIKLGMERGIELGIERGEEQSRRKTAITLMDMGMPVEKIAIAVDTSIEQIEKWKKEIC